MEIKRSGSQPSGKGPAENFTGAVRIDPLFQAPTPARVVISSVTFELGARTAWHSHPLGQTLIVQEERSNLYSKTGDKTDAEANTWKEQAGSIGYRAGLHGHDL